MGVFDDYYGVKKNRDGFVSAVKRSGASMVGGLGEIYADVTGDQEHDNALTRFDDRIADNPWLAMRVAAGGAAGFVGPGLAGKGLGAVGSALKARRVAQAGEALNSFGAQTAIAGLPSVRAIGEQQRLSGEGENDLLKYAAGATVGGIETKFGIVIIRTVIWCKIHTHLRRTFNCIRYVSCIAFMRSVEPQSRSIIRRKCSNCCI